MTYFCITFDHVTVSLLKFFLSRNWNWISISRFHALDLIDLWEITPRAVAVGDLSIDILFILMQNLNLVLDQVQVHSFINSRRLSLGPSLVNQIFLDFKSDHRPLFHILIDREPNRWLILPNLVWIFGVYIGQPYRYYPDFRWILSGN